MVNFNPIELIFSYTLVGLIIILPIVLLTFAIVIAIIVKRKSDAIEKGKTIKKSILKYLMRLSS